MTTPLEQYTAALGAALFNMQTATKHIADCRRITEVLTLEQDYTSRRICSDLDTALLRAHRQHQELLDLLHAEDSLTTGE